MLKNAVGSATLVRLVQDHRRPAALMTGVLVAVVAALLAFGVAERSAAAQSEPETVGAVTGLSATAEGKADGTVGLTWNAAENAQVYFVLFVKADDLASGNYAGIQMRAFNGTEATIDGLEAGASYHFIARGMRYNISTFEDFWGDWSGMATVAAAGVADGTATPPDESQPMPAEPQTVGVVTGLTITAEGQPPGSVHLIWNAAENAQVYFVLFVKADDLAAGNYTGVQMRVFNDTEATIDGLEGGASYHFIARGMRYNISTFEEVWGDNWSSMTTATPTAEPTIAFADLPRADRLEPAQANQLKALPWIADGIVDSERDAAQMLIDAARNYPDTFSTLLQKTWVLDHDMTAAETRAIHGIRWSAKYAPALAAQMLEKPWTEDDITRDEASALYYLYRTTHTEDESLREEVIQQAINILAMPFLDSVESPDALAVWDLSKIARTNSSDFLDVMASDKVSDGITNQEAKVVTVLSSAHKFKPESLPVLLDGLDGTNGVYLEERTIELTHSGEVLLVVLRLRDQITLSMDYLESAVRNVEEFMGEPLPTNYVALYFDDATPAGGGYHADTHITSLLNHDDVNHPYWQDTPKHIAHEVGHYYWKGNSNRWWLSEGAADLVSFISENVRVERPLEPDRGPCPYFETISQLESADYALGSPENSCNYSLGQRLFLDLYHTLGDTDFRRGFRNLYLSAERGRPADGCEDDRQSICHLEVAFKANASDDVAAKVDGVIDRWYYGIGAEEPQIPGREDLYHPIQPPEHMAYIWWEWEPDQDHFRELVTDFTIHNDVGDWSDEHGLYLILGISYISGTQFYFGVQTDANRRGKAVVFSRWGTRDLANARWDETYGWTESAGHEGDFIGVRRSYAWGAGDYRIRIAPDGLDSDGEWFGLWITDLDAGETTWIGSLKFPLSDGAARIKPNSYSTLEIYGNDPIRPIDIPQWHVSIKRPLGDNVPSVRGLPGYGLTTDSAVQNSEVRYDPPEDAVHLQVGGTTERKTPATGHIDFKTLATLNDLEHADRLEPAQANQLEALPWIADGIDDSERDSAEKLVEAAIWWPDTFNALLQKSWIQDAITRDEATVIEYIYWLTRSYSDEETKLRVSEAVVALLDMPFLDSVEPFDAAVVIFLRRLASNDLDTFDALLRKPWIQDAITGDEATVIEHIYRLTLSYSDEATRLRISEEVVALLDMPFLDRVESPDALAVWSLQRIAGTDTSAFLDIMSHSKISDGITDEEAKIVVLLWEANERNQASLQALLDGLDGTGGVYKEERTTNLPHSGEVLLAIIRFRDNSNASMDYFEHAARNVEEFMGEPLGSNYVAWYFGDAIGGHHAGTHITSEPSHDDVNHPYWQDTPAHIAHEVGHYYWTSARGTRWISEGGAELVSAISEHERIGRPLEPFRTHCAEFQAIKDIVPTGGLPHASCDYYLGSQLFLNLYHTLGEETFRQRFHSLYLKSQSDDPTDDCEGTYLDICHVEAAFKAGASDDVAAKVDGVIDRWYYGVVTRELEYSYSISVSDDWTEEDEGRYNRASPWSQLRITSLDLGNSATLAQYAAWVRDGLQEEWWDNFALFEITSLHEEQIDGHDFYSITYRVQESATHCVVDVAELITVSSALPGSQHGYRVRMWMCEGDVADYGQDRLQTLHSFRVTTEPSKYYRQFLSVKDVVIKAKDTVDPDALYAAGDIVGAMLSGRQDIADCMANVGAGLAIIPKDDYVTTLPEFSYLKGTSDFTGRPRDSFAIRGLGAVKGQPVSSTSEEQLLGLPRDQYPHNRFPHIGLITVHEFAHGIQNLCFTQSDWELWEGFYDTELQAGIFPGTHMMHDVYEFFAVLSTAYFEVTDEIGRDAGRSTVASDFPDVYESLEEIYGGAILASEYRERRF